MKSLRASIALVLFVCVFCLSVHAAEKAKPAKPNDPLSQAEELLIDKKYAEALRLLGGDGIPATRQDYALLLTGNAHFYAKEYDAALAAYESLITKYVNSEWRRKAIFKKADCYLALKQFDKAAETLEPMLAYLVSEKRQQEVADFYLKYAAQYFAPEKSAGSFGKEAASDFAKAKQLFTKSLELGLPKDKEAEVRYMAARCDFETRNFGPAAQAFAQLAKEFAKSAIKVVVEVEQPAKTSTAKPEKAKPNVPLVEGAKFYLAQCYLNLNQMPEARKTLRDFLADFAKSDLRAEATYAIAQTYRVPTPANDRELELGVKALRDFIKEFPSAPKTTLAEYNVAASFFNRNRLDDAIREFKAFVTKHAPSPPPPSPSGRGAGGEGLIPDAKNLLGHGYLRQKKYQLAIDTWQQFLRDHQNHRLWNTVHGQVLTAEFQKGADAYNAKKYDDAVKAWALFADKFPVDYRNPEIMFMLGMIEYDRALALIPKSLGGKAGRSLPAAAGTLTDPARKHLLAAIDQWQKLQSKFADNEFAARGQLMTGQIHEKQFEDFDKAQEAYKLVRVGRWQQEAQRRLLDMREQKFVVYTERTFLSDDPSTPLVAGKPALKLVTRNLKRVNFRGYKIDVEDYFRKQHTIRGIDALDLALIEADQRWSFDVPSYKQFKETESEVALPFKEPGVYAIVCSAPKTNPLPAGAGSGSSDSPPSPSGGGGDGGGGDDPNAPSLEATTVVMISDLAVMTKATPRDLLVFAQNLRTKSPQPNARVLLSDGAKVMEIGRTGNDGVLHKLLKDLKDFKDVRDAKVLAVSPIATQPSSNSATGPVHFASTESNLADLEAVAGLEPKAVIYTDRPKYRPGQTVHAKGIVRKVVGGEYSFAKGDKFNLEVLDPNGVAIQRKQIALSEFGTFDNDVTLPPDAALGEYRIRVFQKKKPSTAEPSEPPSGPATEPTDDDLSFEGAFAVELYKLERVKLAIDLTKRIVLRGEDLKGKLVAKYYYGEPLANRKVRFGWGNEVGEERETNAKGEVEFTIPTRQFEEEQPVRIFARLDEENVGAQTVGYVAVVGLRAKVNTLRRTYLAGERFDVKIDVRDLADKPAAGKFKLHVVKSTGGGEAAVDDEGESATPEAQPQSSSQNDKCGPALSEVEGSATANGAADRSTTPARTTSTTPARTTSTTPARTTSTTPARTGLGVYEVTVDATGKATVSVTVKESGEYILRLSGQDANKNPFTAESRVEVVGDDDVIKLRILNDRDTFKVGDTAKLNVVSRVEKTMALATYEAEQILGYQLVTLDKGSNTVSVPMTAKLAPRFNFAVHLMDGQQLHVAHTRLEVERELKITLTPEKPAGSPGKKHLPGEKVKVAVKVEDQNGKPVKAELSLAVVDEALHALFRGETPKLSEQFFGRDLADKPLLTTSSNTFHYSAEARQHALIVKESDSLLRTMIVGGSATVGVTYASPNARVPANHWAYEALEKLGELGVVNGEIAQSVKNRESLSRLEFGATLGRALQNSQSQSEAVTRDLLTDLQLEFAPEMKQLGLRAEEERAKNGRTDNFGRPGAAGKMGPAGPMGSRGAMPAGGPGGVGFGSGGGGLAERSRVAGGTVAAKPAPPPPAGLAQVLTAGDKSGVQDGVALAFAFGEAGLNDPDRAALLDRIRGEFPETAYWNAFIVTDDKGAATIEFTLPDSLTEWRLDAKAVTVATLTGEGNENVTAAKPFLAELKLPAILQERDKLQLIAVVHNNTDKAVTAEVTLKSTLTPSPSPASGRGESIIGRQTVEVPANGMKEISFPYTVSASKDIEFEFQAVAGSLKDTLKQTVVVRPFGVEYVAAKGGTATGDRLVEVVLPDHKYATKEMIITVGPSLDRALLDAVSPLIPTLSPTRGERALKWRPTIFDDVTARGQMLIASVKYLRALGRGETPEHHRFVADLESALARIHATQNDDGGWAWSGRGQASDVFVTANAVEVLADAKQLGLPCSQERLAKALAFLQTQFSQSAEQDHQRKAAILAAQAAARVADFAHANRLLRLRNSLDTRALCLTMIALADMERAGNSRELQSVLEERIKHDGSTSLTTGGSFAYLTPSAGPTVSTTIFDVRYGGDDVELTALALLALAKSDAKSPRLAELAAWLWSKRLGTQWGTSRATAAAVKALAFYSSLVKPRASNYTLTVSVNDKEVKRLEVNGTTVTTDLAVPTELLTDAASGKPTSARVNFAIAGSGEFAYSAVLRGFSDEIKEKRDQFVITRNYLQAPLTYEGKVVPRGFHAAVNLDSSKQFTNYANAVPAGKHAQVSLYWTNPGGYAVGSYVVVREPLPSGAKVLEESVKGTFEHFQIGDGEITFYYRVPARQFTAGNAQFDLYGATPGEYTSLPTRAWSYHQPENYGLAVGKEFKVLARDTKSADEYRLSPDELYFLGLKAFEKQDYALANKHLGQLFNSYQLRDVEERESARMLFVANLEATDSGGVASLTVAGLLGGSTTTAATQPLSKRATAASEAVRFFEIIHEKYPNVVVTFRDLLRVAKAYHALNERERETQIYRSTADALFGKESRVAGVLNEQGEFIASIDFSRRLLQLFPDLASVESAWLGLAQEIDGRATAATPASGGGTSDPRLAKEKLVQRAIAEFRQFLVLYPESPEAADASFSFASTLLREERLDDAIDWAGRSRERYAGSAYDDDFEYIGAYAYFLNEQFEEALRYTAKLTTTTYRRPDGTRGPSEHKDFATYIAAQVYHSQGKAAEAVKQYEQVADKFADAREALGYIKRKQVELPEVTFVRGAEPVLLQLLARNVKEADLTVYKVDLLKFYQQHRSLKDVAKMNLAGIKPMLEQRIVLQTNGPLPTGPAQPSDYEEVKKVVPLTLADKGAYFVLVKAEGAAASGVVLRSDLNLEVQEDQDSGRVRVNVVNRAFNRFQPKTEVWVVGSANDGFRKGQSDLRGVLIAEDIRGLATIIAHKDGEYAFYRGQTILQPSQVAVNQPAIQAATRARKQPQTAEEAEKQFKDQALQNLRRQNGDIQSRGRANFKNQLGGGGYGGGGNTAGKAF